MVTWSVATLRLDNQHGHMVTWTVATLPLDNQHDHMNSAHTPIGYLKTASAGPKPNCRQATWASASVHWSSHTVPQIPLYSTSTLPSYMVTPPTRRMGTLLLITSATERKGKRKVIVHWVTNIELETQETFLAEWRACSECLPHVQTDKHADWQTDRWLTNKQTYRQTDRHPCLYLHTPLPSQMHDHMQNSGQFHHENSWRWTVLTQCTWWSPATGGPAQHHKKRRRFLMWDQKKTTQE